MDGDQVRDDNDDREVKRDISSGKANDESELYLQLADDITPRVPNTDSGATKNEEYSHENKEEKLHSWNTDSNGDGIFTEKYVVGGTSDKQFIKPQLHDESQTSCESKKEQECSIETIDIDEFLIRSGECGRYQFYTVFKMMLISFPLAYTPFIFYFIGFDPHWVNLVNSTSHLRDDDSRCAMNRTEWRYDYDKTTMTTEYELICENSWKLSLMGSIVFIGWALGSFVLGFFSDRYGRKLVMFPCLFIDLFCLLLHAFVKSFWVLVVIRFIMGFFHASPALNAYILIVELIGPNFRVLAANVGGVIWGIATAMLALKAFLIDDWRTLCIAASTPYFAFILIGFWVLISSSWYGWFLT